MSFLTSGSLATLAVLAICLSIGTAIPSPTNKDIIVETPENGKLTLQHLGIVEGVGYYAEPNTTMTWVQGIAACKAANLKLASIVTMEQVVFLRSALYTSYSSNEFWTAGRNSLAPSSFVWDGLSTHLNMELFADWHNYGFSSSKTDYTFCITTTSSGTSATSYLYLRARTCASAYRVLCQTV